MTIFQGDQIMIALTLTDDQGNPITGNDAEEVVITLGSITRKTSDDNPVYYDGELEAWMVPIYQTETSALPAGMARMQARVKFDDGAIGSATVATVFVLPAQNAEVL